MTMPAERGTGDGLYAVSQKPLPQAGEAHVQADIDAIWGDR
jgi:hypothetical protein